MLQEFGFDSPATLEEACRLLAETGGRPIAGGTDVIPQMRDGRFQAGHLIDLGRLDDLNYIKQIEGRIVIGGLTTFRSLLDSELLEAQAPALVQAAALVGGVQTRARGTLAGNLANASPAGDTQPPLLVLDAHITLISVDGQRRLPLAEFLVGPGKTLLQPNELIQEISFAAAPPRSDSLFMRLGNRRGMAIAVVSVAAYVRLGQNNEVEEARIALGAAAPTAVRCPKSESILRGRQLTPDAINQAADQAVGECSPIDDIRASAAYRRHAVRILVRRSLSALAAK